MFDLDNVTYHDHPMPIAHDHSYIFLLYPALVSYIAN